MTTVNVRIEEKTKKAANKVFADIGMDMSSGIKIFLQQVVNEKGLPFKPTKNPAALRAIWDAEVEHAIEHGRRYKSGKELMDDLLK